MELTGQPYELDANVWKRLQEEPMKTRLFIAIIILASLVLPGCQVGGLLPPRTVHYPAPDLSVDMSPFEQAGCEAGAYGRWNCPQALLPQDCDEFFHPGDLLGGLGVPLLKCQHYPLQHNQPFPETQDYLYSDGCMMPVSVHYLAQIEGEFRLIRNRDDLKAAFAPVESTDEALSYALAATGQDARYDIQPAWGYRYFVGELEDTRVVPTEDGYAVHLYHYTLCGCGPHTTYAVTVHVQTGGEVKITETLPVYEDPAEDGLCVD